MLTSPLYTLLAARLRAHVLERGVAIAIGEGRAEWDSAPPVYDRATSSLVAEVARRTVPADQIVFLSARGEPAPEPTPRLRFSVTFEPGEGTGPLRECGLVGVAMPGAPAGELLSYHVHPRIEKGPAASLRREVYIDLAPRPFAPGSRVTRWLGNTRSGELHDLDALTSNCQVDEIRVDRRFYFTSVDEAAGYGYDPCAYCLGSEAPEEPPEDPDGGEEPPGEALYDIGQLPDELAVRWPAAPQTDREVEVTEHDGELRVEQDRTRLVVRTDLEQLTLAASDIDVEVEDGIRIGNVFVDRGRARLRFRGGRYGRIELAVPAQHVPPPPEFREEWLIRDVLFDGITVDTQEGESAFLLRGRRIAVLRSRVRAGHYAVWVGDTGELQSEDVVLAGNVLEAAGPEATVRLVSVLRSAVVENRLANPVKHNYRVHGRSDLAFAARNVIVDAGVMLASNAEEDEVGTVWFLNNTLHHQTPSLLVVGVPLGARLDRFVATGNTIYSDVWDCFLCDEPPPGWTVRDNSLRPYRLPLD